VAAVDEHQTLFAENNLHDAVQEGWVLGADDVVDLEVLPVDRPVAARLVGDLAEQLVVLGDADLLHVDVVRVARQAAHVDAGLLVHDHVAAEDQRVGHEPQQPDRQREHHAGRVLRGLLDAGAHTLVFEVLLVEVAEGLQRAVDCVGDQLVDLRGLVEVVEQPDAFVVLVAVDHARDQVVEVA